MTGVLQEVGPGCWAWLRLPGDWGETNIGLVVGDGESLLIDTPWDRRLTRSMLETFEPATDRAPISLVFNTHPDPDHWWGNAELPGAEVLASAAASEAMRHEPTPGRLAAQRRLSHATGYVPGRLGRVGRYVSGMLAPFDFDDVTLRFPDRTFIGRRTETVGGRTVELIDYGGAHTKSDSVVFVPDARVVFTGDLLFNKVTPVMWQGPTSSWTGVLDEIAALDADVFVAGHGQVGTRAELRELHDYWTWLADAVAGHRGAGRGPAEAAKRLVATPEFESFRSWVSPERIHINVATIDRELRGLGPIPTGPIARGRAFDGVACMCHTLTGAP
jgi:cyclase